MEIEISSEVKGLMEARGVREEDISAVVEHAETTGEKLYQPDANRYLAKLRIGEGEEGATFYAEYSLEDGKCIVQTAYMHMSDFVEE